MTKNSGLGGARAHNQKGHCDRGGLLQLDWGSLDAKAFAYLDLPPNGSLGHFNRQSHFLWFDRLDVPWISCLDSESRQGIGLFNFWRH